MGACVFHKNITCYWFYIGSIMSAMNRTTLITSIEERGLHDPQRTGPLYRNLARILGELIEEGKLAPAVGLPPERDLAEELGLGRITVRNAYKELLAQGAVNIVFGRHAFARQGAGRARGDEPYRQAVAG
jgi:GntR family transcriptional regulator